MTELMLADAFGHHSWANARLLDVCASLSDEQLATPVPAIYSNVLDTLRHIVGADRWYLFIITGGRVLRIEEDHMDLEDLRAASDLNRSAWEAVIGEHTDPRVVVVAHRDDGSEGRAPIGIRLAQALHHGSDHRSQVCTALTTLGIEPPEIDVWAYGEEIGSYSESAPAP